MQIEHLTLQHFRGYERVTFDFQPGMNLLVGINGVGKSTVLEALRLLLSNALPRVSASRDRPFRASADDIAVGQEWLYAALRFRINGIALEEDMRVWRSPEDPESVIPPEPIPTTRAVDRQMSLGEDEEEVSRQTLYRFRGIIDEGPSPKEGSGSTNPKEQLARHKKSLESLPKKLQRAAEQAPAIYFSAHRSLINFGDQTKSELAIGGQASAFVGALEPERQLKVAQFARWWVTREALTREPDFSAAARALAQMQALEQAVTRFLEAFTSVQAVSKPKPTLRLTKAGAVLDVRQLSDGERSVLAMVLDIARRLAEANPSSADPISEGRAVVLIDEIDLHLHPRWQRTIVQKLTETFPRCQFIATTHSPFIIQSLNAGQLINLGPQDDVAEPAIVNEEDYSDKSVEDIAEHVMGVEMPQKSKRYQQMMEVAEQYFRLLRSTKPATSEEKEILKRELDQLSIPFSDDPAYMALLKVEREIILGKEGHATN